jgi:RHS repeat-associated protein
MYQLVRVEGESESREAGVTMYRAGYGQRYVFDEIGNMTRKESESRTSNGKAVGTDLNYVFDYSYYEGYAHRAERIGSRYYRYDGNGNVTAEREGGHAEERVFTAEMRREGEIYGTNYGFALEREGEEEGAGEYERRYEWNERNELVGSLDAANRVQYRYGADGKRAVKYNEKTGREAVYFNNQWDLTLVNGEWRWNKHIYVGSVRVVTKNGKEGNENTGDERDGTYYYHGDHVGSAQVVTNGEGKIYERYEYTPYGEVWIEWKNGEVQRNEKLPYRFTGKELDEETGLYYYGARYLDPRASRWLSADPAMGEYIPGAPVNEEARRRNGNLPGMGGIYNTVNLHLYHYAGNNPVKYTDPDGRANRSQAEIKFVKELLGSLGEHIHRNSDFIEIPDGRSASTPLFYSKQIWLGASIFSNPMGSSDGRNTLIHELFHQVQYSFEPGGAASGLSPSAFDQLIVEQGLYSMGINVYDYGNLSQYSSLSDMPYYESQAQMVGDFAELYYDGRYGGGLTSDNKMKIKEMARILDASGIKTEATKWVQKNY